RRCAGAKLPPPGVRAQARRRRISWRSKTARRLHISATPHRTAPVGTHDRRTGQPGDAMGQHTDEEIASVLELDLWHEHRFQMTTCVAFRTSLRSDGQGNWAGDEGALSSALIHTRALIEFYDPRADRHMGDKDV